MLARIPLSALLLGLLAVQPVSARTTRQAAARHLSPSLSSLPPGRIVTRLTSVSDLSEQYAVYLPSRYRTDRSWPVLVLLDPRGRALLPMERVREVAERLGYIVLSSWNSRSD